jgi:hypothetical protein
MRVRSSRAPSESTPYSERGRSGSTLRRRIRLTPAGGDPCQQRRAQTRRQGRRVTLPPTVCTYRKRTLLPTLERGGLTATPSTNWHTAARCQGHTTRATRSTVMTSAVADPKLAPIRRVTRNDQHNNGLRRHRGGIGRYGKRRRLSSGCPRAPGARPGAT